MPGYFWIADDLAGIAERKERLTQSEYGQNGFTYGEQEREADSTRIRAKRSSCMASRKDRREVTIMGNENIKLFKSSGRVHIILL